MIIRIDDQSDPRLEPYRDIRERDLLGRDAFVAEGEVVLRQLVRSPRHRAQSVLLAEKRVDGLAEVLGALPDEVPVYVAAQPVLDAIAGFHLHRGILAIGARAASASADVLLGGLGPRALVVALFGIGNHDNMGGIFRNAAAFGADAVLLDATCCDPLYRKAIRVSVGAALSVPFARLGPDTDALALLAEHGFDPVALSPSATEPLSALTRRPRAALLLGSEGPGLPHTVLAGTRAIAIPMAGAFDSLNVAVACGVALHHMVFMAGAEA